MAADRKKYQIVMRMRGMFPDEFAGYEMHRLRRGGRLRHVDKRLSKFNRHLHGKETWAREALLEIARMRDEGYSAGIDGLTKRRRKSDLQQRTVEGPRDPWKNTRHGPMREIILTAHREWFGAERPDTWDGSLNGREAAFEKHAMDWLRTAFGDDLVHARAGMDEEALSHPRRCHATGDEENRGEAERREVLGDIGLADTEAIWGGQMQRLRLTAWSLVRSLGPRWIRR